MRREYLSNDIQVVVTRRVKHTESSYTTPPMSLRRAQARGEFSTSGGTVNYWVKVRDHWSDFDGASVVFDEKSRPYVWIEDEWDFEDN